MNKQEVLNWEMVGQAVWLVVLAVTVVVLLAQSMVLPVEIPVTGAGGLVPLAAEAVQVLQP